MINPFDIIRKTEDMKIVFFVRIMGGNMNERVNVLDINIDRFTAKEAMKRFVTYMETEPLKIVELVTVGSIMQLEDMKEVKESVNSFEMVFPADVTILKSAGVTDKKILQQTQDGLFVKMLFKYLHKNHKRVYLLVDTESEGQIILKDLEHCYKGIQIGGIAKVAQEDRADDMIVNAINGAEVDCVISCLPSPLQEDFISKNRKRLNARVWLGMGAGELIQKRMGEKKSHFAQFLIRKIFQKEVERRKRVVTESWTAVK